MALTLAPAMHEVRAALAEALAHAGASGEAAAMVLSMIAPDAAPLVTLSDPSAALGTFERALAAHGRPEEATVARELRALAGGLDDAAHVELRGRRLGVDPSAPVPPSLDASVLRQYVVPDDAPAVCFDLASVLSGVERRLVRLGLEELRADPRERLPATSGHPLLWIAHRVASALGVARPEIVTVGSLASPRIVAVQDALWLAVPQALLAHPEPVQTAAIVRPLVRIALGLPWFEDGALAANCALLLAVARQSIPGYGANSSESEVRSHADDAARRVARVVGRAQRKTLTSLVPALSSRPAPTIADVEALGRALAATELRAAFVLTGDLLATLDAARAVDRDLAAATASAGNAALRAALLHPLVGDVARFALVPQATALRWRAGTLWTPRRDATAR